MKAKRIWKALACIMCCVVVMQQAVCAAVIGKVEEQSDTLVISGTIEDGAGCAVAINILKPGADLSQATANEGTLTDYSIYVKTGVADEQGRYQFTVKKPDYGEYEIVVSAGEDLRETRPLYLVSDAQMKSRLEAFNQTPATKMAAQIEADKGLFGLQFEPYDTLVTAGRNLDRLYQILADTTFGDVEQLRRTFRQETLATAVRYAEKAAGLEQLLQTYEEEWFYGLKPEFLTYWNDSTFSGRDGKKQAAEQLLKQKAQVVDFKSAQLEMLRSVAVSAMITNKGFSQADAALLLFAPVYEIDTTVYGGLNEKKELVYKEMMKKNISSVGNIKSAFENAIQTVTAPEHNGSGTGTGGGGGGGGTSARPGGGTSGATNIDIYQNGENNVSNQQQIFRDLNTVPWAEKEIMELAQRGILQGRAEGQFEPNATVAREEFVKMLVVAFGIDDMGAAAAFDDISADNWCYAYVAAAVKTGIVQGISGNQFGIGQNISRQDMAVMAMRTSQAVGISLPAGDISFEDSGKIASYASEAVGMLAAAGIIRGTDGNCFHPEGIATRAEAAKIIYGLLQAAGR